ncbi:helix-turn-helix transcriptional regulator [Qipengyuania sp. SM2507]
MSDRLLRRPEVEQEVGLKKSAIYEYMAEGTFPKPVRLGRRAVAWRASEIEEWKATREPAFA